MNSDEQSLNNNNNIKKESTYQVQGSNIVYRARSGDYMKFSITEASFRSFGVAFLQRVNTPKGEATGFFFYVENLVLILFFFFFESDWS